MKKIFHKVVQNKKWTVRIAIFCTVFVLIACLLPARQIPKMDVPLIDKWVHLLAFGGLAFWWSAVFKTFRWKQFFTIILFSLFFGGVIEMLQSSGITRGRSFEYMDIVADGIGGIIGAFVFMLFHQSSGDRDEPAS